MEEVRERLTKALAILPMSENQKQEGINLYLKGLRTASIQTGLDPVTLYDEKKVTERIIEVYDDEVRKRQLKPADNQNVTSKVF